MRDGVHARDESTPPPSWRGQYLIPKAVYLFFYLLTETAHNCKKIFWKYHHSYSCMYVSSIANFLYPYFANACMPCQMQYPTLTRTEQVLPVLLINLVTHPATSNHTNHIQPLLRPID